MKYEPQTPSYISQSIFLYNLGLSGTKLIPNEVLQFLQYGIGHNFLSSLYETSPLLYQSHCTLRLP